MDAMTHDPLCRYDIIEYACMCPLIARVRADQDSKWVDIIRDRKVDLESCDKPDDCRTKAEGVQLVLDDAIGYLGLVLWGAKP
jgi:hypothetical protein